MEHSVSSSSTLQIQQDTSWDGTLPTTNFVISLDSSMFRRVNALEIFTEHQCMLNIVKCQSKQQSTFAAQPKLTKYLKMTACIYIHLFMYFGLTGMSGGIISSRGDTHESLSWSSQLDTGNTLVPVFMGGGHTLLLSEAPSCLWKKEEDEEDEEEGARGKTQI